MSPGHDDNDATAGGAPVPASADREELERQIRDDHHRSWRDQPRGLGCLVVFGFLLLTTIAAVIGVILLLASVL